MCGRVTTRGGEPGGGARSPASRDAAGAAAPEPLTALQSNPPLPSSLPLRPRDLPPLPYPLPRPDPPASPCVRALNNFILFGKGNNAPDFTRGKQPAEPNKEQMSKE